MKEVAFCPLLCFIQNQQHISICGKFSFGISVTWVVHRNGIEAIKKLILNSTNFTLADEGKFLVWVSVVMKFAFQCTGSVVAPAVASERTTWCIQRAAGWAGGLGRAVLTDRRTFWTLGWDKDGQISMVVLDICQLSWAPWVMLGQLSLCIS